jgi:hypothetical protein
MEFVKRYNGGGIEKSERDDAELYYMKSVVETYLRHIM